MPRWLNHSLDALVGIAAGALIFWAIFGAGVWAARLMAGGW